MSSSDTADDWGQDADADRRAAYSPKSHPPESNRRPTDYEAILNATWRNGLKHVALPRHRRPAKRRIEEMLLHDPPGNQFLRLVVALLQKQPLRKSVFQLIRVRQRRVNENARA